MYIKEHIYMYVHTHPHILLQISAFAGEDITLGIEATDELGEATPTVVRLTQATKVTLHYRQHS